MVRCINFYARCLLVILSLIVSSSAVLAQDNIEKINIQAIKFADYFRFIFVPEDGELVDFVPSVDGDRVIIDFAQPNNFDISEIADKTNVIDSFGASADNRSVIIKMNATNLKIRNFIGENGSNGFDVFFSNVGSKKKQILMSSLESIPESASDELLEAYNTDAKEKRKVITSNIITYPLSFVGPPNVNQLYKAPASFVGAPAFDLTKVAVYEIEKQRYENNIITDFFKNSTGTYITFGFAEPRDISSFSIKRGDYIILAFSGEHDVILPEFPVDDDVIESVSVINLGETEANKQEQSNSTANNAQDEILKEVGEVDLDKIGETLEKTVEQAIDNFEGDKRKKVTVLQVKLKPIQNVQNNIRALFYRNNYAWVLELANESSKINNTPTPLRIAIESEWGENKIALQDLDILGPVTVVDPVTKMDLKLFLSRSNGKPVANRREFVDLIFPVTIHGFAVLEKSDLISYIQEDQNKILISKLPNLNISDEIVSTGFLSGKDGSQVISKTAGIFPEQSIFPFLEAVNAIKEKEKSLEIVSETLEEQESNIDEELIAHENMTEEGDTSIFEDKKVGIYTHFNEHYSDVVASNEEEAFTQLSHELADFMFQKAMYPEATGLYYNIIINDPSYEKLDKVNFSFAAAQFLARKYNEAYNNFVGLMDANINNASYNELKLWAWASQYMLNKENDIRDYDAIRVDFISSYDKFMQQYDSEVRVFLGIIYMESLVDRGQYEDAVNVFNLVAYDESSGHQENIIKYYKAKLALENGDKDTAIKLYEDSLENIEDRQVRAYSLADMAKYRYNQNEITVEESINKLLYATTIWRDDFFELDIYDYVGDLYLSNNDYEKALDTWKSLIVNFPNTTKSIFVSGKMKDVFIKLFDDGKAYEMEPIDAFRIYFRFRELIPVGQVGDRIAKKVAGFMLSADMIEDALNVINHQIQYRAKGDDKDELVLWLSDILLNNREPEEALNILKMIDDKDASDEIKTRKKYAKAESYVMQEKYFEGLDLVLNDNTVNGNKIKIDLFWVRKNWFGLIDLIEPLLPEIQDTAPEMLTNKELDKIIKLAVAYSAQKMDKELAFLKDNFGTRIEDDKKEELFNYLVSGNEDIDPDRFESTVELEKVERFLQKYSFMPSKNWQNTIEVLEPKVAEYVGVPVASLTKQQRSDIIALALAYTLFEHEDVKVMNLNEKKLIALNRDFKDVTVDRFSIDNFSVLENKAKPIERDAIFEGKIKILDIGKFIPYYESAYSISALNQSIRGSF